MSLTKIHKLTDAQFERLEPWIDQWLEGAFRTQAEVAVSREEIKQAVQCYYAFCGFKPPEAHRIFLTRSPTEAVLMATEIAVAVSREPNGNPFDLTPEDLEPIDDLLPNRLMEPSSREILRRYPWSSYQICFRRVRKPSEQLSFEMWKGLNWLENALFDSATERLHSTFTYPDTVMKRIERLKPLTRILADNPLRQVGERSRLFCHPNAGSLPYCTFFRDVAEMDVDFSDLEPIELLFKNVGAGYQMRGAVILSELPVDCHHDEDLRLHCENSPAMRWADGTAIYTWHGTSVPAYVIELRDTLIPELIELEPNVEVRRVMTELFGEARYIASLDAVKVHEDDFGVLYRRKLEETDRDHYAVKVVNSTPEPDGTFKDYFLSVRDPKDFYPNHPRTARAAVASTFRDSRTGTLIFRSPEEYSPMVES